MDDAQKTLNRFLRENPLTQHEPHTYARYVASAWNATWHKQPRRNLAADPTIPILLEGTPHIAKSVKCYINREGQSLDEPLEFPPE
jgi:hypothetical protein